MMRINFFSIAALSLGFGCSVTTAAASSAITADQVAAALNNVGMNTSAKQVVLLSDVVAKTNTPALKVESMNEWSDGGTKIRLSCVEPGDCMPFFVALRPGGGNTIIPTNANRASAAMMTAKQDNNLAVMHAGSRETLVIEGDHVHIRLAVICLENGAIGQTIRVASVDHKQNYLAEVSGVQLLKGKLQ